MVALSPDDRRLLIRGRLYDVVERRELPPLRNSRVFQAAFSHDGRWLATCDSPEVTLIDLKADTERKIDDAQYAGFAPGSDVMAVVNEEGDAVQLVQTATGKVQRTLDLGFKTPADFAVFTPDGKRLLTGSYRDRARLWDLATGKEIALPEDRARIYYPPVFSPDGKRLAQGKKDDHIRLYDARTWAEIAEIELPSTASNFRFSPDGSQLWVQCWKDLCVVDVAAAQLTARTKLKDNAYGAAFSRDGSRAFVVTSSRIELYGRGEKVEAVVEREIPTTPAARRDEGEAAHLAFSPDGKVAVEIASDEATVLRDAASGRMLARIPVPKSGGTILSGSVAAARPVLYRFADDLVELFSLPDGRRLGEIRIPEGEIQHAALSEDGRYLAVVIEKGPLLLLDAATGKRLGHIDAMASPVQSIAIAPQGQELALTLLGSGEAKHGQLKQYTLPDLREKASHKLHERCFEVEYSPDGRFVAVMEDYDIVVRQTADGRRTTIVRNTNGRSFVYTHDGRHIATEPGSGHYEEKAVAVFDAVTGRPVHFFVEGQEHDFDGARDLLLSPDGRSLVATKGYRDVFWWPVPGALVAPRRASPGAPSGAEPAGSGIVAEARVIEPLRTREIDANTSGYTIILGPDERTFDILFKPRDGRMLVRRYDALTGRTVDAILPMAPAALPVIASDDGRVWLAYHRGCDFWDAAGPRITASRAGIETSRAALAPDGSFALFAGPNGALVRHEPVNGQIRSRMLPGNFGELSALAISPDGRRAAVADRDNVVLVDLDDSTRRTEMEVKRSPHLFVLQFAPDGKRLAGAADGEVLVWSTETGEMLLAQRLHGSRRVLAVSPDGETFATIAEDRDGRFVGLWDLATGYLRARLIGPKYGVDALRFTADGTRLQAVENRKTYFAWDLSPEPAAVGGSSAPESPADGALLLHTFDVEGHVKSIRFADEGQVLTGYATRIDLSTGGRQASSAGDGGVNPYSDGPTWMSADGNRHIRTDNDLLDRKLPDARKTPRVLIWSPEDEKYQAVALTVAGAERNRKERAAFGDYRQIVANEQISRVATLHLDNSLYLWAVGPVRDSSQVDERRAAECHVKNLSKTALAAAFNGTGAGLAVGTPEGIELWDAVRGDSLGKLEGPSGAIHLIRFSHDQKQMATFGNPGLELWQLPAEKGDLKAMLLKKLATADAPIIDVRFSPDDRRLAVALENRPPEVYDLSGGELLARCEGTETGAYGLAFSPDGTLLAGTCTDERFRVWQLP